MVRLRAHGGRSAALQDEFCRAERARFFRGDHDLRTGNSASGTGCITSERNAPAHIRVPAYRSTRDATTHAPA